MNDFATAIAPQSIGFQPLQESALTFAFSFGSEHVVFDGHYPQFPIVPGVLLLETAARGVIALLGAEARWVGVQSARFQSPVRPGERVVVEVLGSLTTAELQLAQTAVRVKVRLLVAGRIVCTATHLVASRELGDQDRREGISVSLPDEESAAINILSVLPHRPPILLVDRVEAVVAGQWIRTRKCVSVNEALRSAEDSRAPFPSSLMLESWCQSAGLLVCAEDPNPDVTTGKLMLFGGLRDVQFFGSARPGDVLSHQVRLERDIDGTAVLSGFSTVEGRVVMTIGSITLARRSAYPATETVGSESDGGSE